MTSVGNYDNGGNDNDVNDNTSTTAVPTKKDGRSDRRGNRYQKKSSVNP